jgi:hypothetical protein
LDLEVTDGDEGDLGGELRWRGLTEKGRWRSSAMARSSCCPKRAAGGLHGGREGAQERQLVVSCSSSVPWRHRQRQGRLAENGINSGKIGQRRRKSEEELTKKRRGGSERLQEWWNNGATVR